MAFVKAREERERKCNRKREKIESKTYREQERDIERAQELLILAGKERQRERVRVKS